MVVAIVVLVNAISELAAVTNWLQDWFPQQSFIVYVPFDDSIGGN